ncbi:MAG: hypothetical protein F6K40_19725 [Okeania sp. SIO3I5]|uniref:hypothetical protein n=1 Tax=Okeania sp. SIO3I5 TaxID=2607805 RepID=UPI0013BE749A|nr:hypothetical protein [Okeania sp. SIO3I5]NEQ38373.1 hypothetical protein [Okeania sp. SIO3I5]
MWEDWDCRRNNFSLIFLPRATPKSSLDPALFTEKMILFHDLKWLKPLRIYFLFLLLGMSIILREQGIGNRIGIKIGVPH